MNPSDPTDHIVSVGDLVRGSPGVANSRAIRDALETLKSTTITVPVWDESTLQGKNALYRVTAFASVLVTDFQLPRQNRISVIFNGVVDCEPPPTGNDPPEAIDDAYATAEDTTLNVAAPGVLGNDSDPDGDPLSALLASDVSNGTLSLNPDGSFSYTPTPGYSGTDTFTYTASDGSLDSNTATVTITVSPVNDPPVAVDDVYATAEDTTLNVAAPGVLGNDSDPEGDSLTAVLASLPADGTLTLNADGSFTYTPNADFSGADSFTYIANDGSLDSNTATVTIAVSLVNDPPVITSTPVTTATEGEDYTYDVEATDADGDPLVFSLQTAPLGMTMDPATGLVQWTPGFDDAGDYPVELQVSDVQAGTNTQAFTLTVQDVNRPPTFTSIPVTLVLENMEYA